MSNITKPNPPAFPHCVEDGAGGYEQFTGMSLRDHFAGQALAGALVRRSGRDKAEWIATDCYNIADAMLAHRAVKPLSETQPVSIKQNL
jgi:hypothetical protein